LDSEIKNEEANQIEELLDKHTNIKAIFCNGGKSFKNAQKILGKDSKIPVFLLPSTSPLHTISFERKLEDWMMIKNYL
jgi:G:T/U-mismatch repair DNA glycosylase